MEPDDRAGRTNDPLYSPEMDMRRDFVRSYRLRVASEFPCTPEELERWKTESDQLAASWLGSKSEWSQHWQYLDEACDRFRNDPDDAHAHLTGLTTLDTLDPDPATAATKLASLIQAAVMDDERRIATALPRVIDDQNLQPLPYTATYAPDGQQATSRGCTSWWQAREWLYDSSHIDQKSLAHIEIRARDSHSGHEHILMSADSIGPIALRAELGRLDRVLGAGQEVDGKPWIDELAAEVLADEYREALRTQLNPWAGQLRFEHQLHTDDLRDRYLDLTTHAGIDSGAQLLADIDDDLRHRNLYADEPTAHTWLDDAINTRQGRSGWSERQGVRTHYRAPDDPAVVIVAGHDTIHGGTPWYAEVRIMAENGEWISGDQIPAGRYATCSELITALQHYRASEPRSGTSYPVPAEVSSALWGFDNQITQSANDLAAARNIHHSIRTNQPYGLQNNQTTQPHTTEQSINSIAAEQNPTPATSKPVESKAIERNRERARQRRQNINRHPRRNTQSRRRRP
ncbi:hypothetical protein [Nocardia macrotermitis]|uniref:Uncharacterized protein n=1 Tax=Nocardia macrotermitis TaxID=2585198 RepID=A0A7K0D154_9NOCA|nr:hypothetical protein [Nocardia macrotermitis]MQY18962.1 hypothetical protein [Nocardia macrotermitis]